MIEQWGILLQEEQWWSNDEYCYKRTSGEAVGNIVTRAPAIRAVGILLEEDQLVEQQEISVRRRPVVGQ